MNDIEKKLLATIETLREDIERIALQRDRAREALRAIKTQERK